MYLSNLQLNALIAINGGKAHQALPGMIDYLLQAGLITHDLAGYTATPKGQEVIRANNIERENLKNELADNSYARWLRGD